MKKRCLSAIAALGVLLAGCYPSGPEYIEEYDLVVTNHDEDFDFSSVTTFAMPDKVVKITGEALEGEDVVYVKEPYASTILNTIRNNMTALGYEEVGVDDDADILLLPTATETTNIYFYYDWWYWDWWYGGYYPPWGWYYPGYGYPSVSSYQTGSVFIQMVVPDAPTAADNVPVVWSSILNGLLEGSVESVNDRIEEGVDQAFQQSPYLQQ